MVSNSTPSVSKILGGILLVAGCCIGAGMLGLPVLAGKAGFFPSCILFFLSWMFMASTGLLLIEVVQWFQGPVNLITLADQTLGKWGKRGVILLYGFLFYCLMVAYTAGSGNLLVDLIQEETSLQLAPWLGSLITTFCMALFVYLGTRTVDFSNRLLMIGLILSYVLLFVWGAPHVSASNLHVTNWVVAPLVLPAMIISFGFHNLVPNLHRYLEGNVKALRCVIILGSLLPLVIYLAWQWLVLGMVSNPNEFQYAIDEGSLITRLLKNTVGSPLVIDVAHHFAFFAIVTSFLTVSYTFVDFFADGTHIRNSNLGKAFLCSLVYIPPLILAFVYPQIFLQALNYAGAFGAVLLFGVIPVLMAWKGRYHEKRVGEVLLPGGKFSLLLLLVIASCIFLMQLYVEIKGVA